MLLLILRHDFLRVSMLEQLLLAICQNETDHSAACHIARMLLDIKRFVLFGSKQA